MKELRRLQENLKVADAEKQRAYTEYDELMGNAFDKWYNDEMDDETYFALDEECAVKAKKYEMEKKYRQCENDLINHSIVILKEMGKLNNDMVEMFKHCNRNIVYRSKLVPILMKL